MWNAEFYTAREHLTANEFGRFPAFASCPSAAGEDIIMKIIDRHDIYADIFSFMEATALDLINEISGYIWISDTNR